MAGASPGRAWLTGTCKDDAESGNNRSGRGGKISNRIAHFALDFLRKESVCVRSQAPSLTGFPSRPRQRRWASAGFGW